jgi:adenylylsulfate kinase-like enzyme
MKTPFVLLLTGKPNSGKTTLAYALLQKQLRNCLIIDGDKHREMQFLGNLGFTKEDILKNNEHVIKLAKFAQDQGFNVVISQIAPYIEQRDNMRKSLENFYEVYLNCPDMARASRPNYQSTELMYEQSIPDLYLNTDVTNIDGCVDVILGSL